jgi:hypothetical protein
MIDTKITAEQRSELLLFLNSVGALQLKRSIFVSAWLAVKKLIYRTKGIRLQYVTCRQPSSLTGLSKVLTIAMMPLLLLVAVSSVFEYGANFSPLIYIYGNVLFIVTLWVSTFIHEYVHILFARKEVNHVNVIQKGLRIGVLHKKLSPSIDRASALLGPLAGSVAALLIAIVIYSASGQTILAIFAAAVGVFHVISWLPMYGDGQTILRLIRSNHHATTT